MAGKIYTVSPILLYHILFTVTREHQISEISQLENLVSSSQELVMKQTRMYIERMDKLVMMDKNIAQLMSDNQKLARKINMMKKKL